MANVLGIQSIITEDGKAIADSSQAFNHNRWNTKSTSFDYVVSRVVEEIFDHIR